MRILNEKDDLKIGQRFGKWVVQRRAESRKHFCDGYPIYTVYYEVKCDCGRMREVRSQSLRKGGSESCGCLMRPNWLPLGESALNAFILMYKQSAKIRELEWALSKEQFVAIALKDCYYCGSHPSPRMGRKRRGSAFLNGIDRKDSDIGYVIENCLPCCKKCNRMKMDLSEKDFLDQVERIHEHKNKRGVTMGVISTNYVTVTCDYEGCGKTVTYLQTNEQEELSKPENAWVLKTARTAVNLVPAPGQQKPIPRLYCGDVCELNAIKTGAHNVPEPKRIVSEPASAAAVAQAAAAAKRAEAATEALRAGGPVTLG
jgi:hypothetical protein